MAVKFYLERVAQRLADLAFALLPRPRPPQRALVDCKIVAHRGEHDNRVVMENTLAAFDAAVDAGVWGIEFDVRWTRDYVPVVIHDPDCRRVFGHDLRIAETDFEELRGRLPQVPSLAETVARFSGRAHMMIELKRDDLPGTARKRERLRQVFTGLEPARDFHILALQLDLFEPVDFIGDRACIPVAELNVDTLSRAALAREFAGICGHYLLLGPRLLGRHRRQGQRIGTGFVVSRYCLYRELNRGIDWIFTDRAVRLIAIRRKLLG